MLMAPLARAGSIAALAVLLVLALVPAWNGPWSALRHAAGGPELGGVRAGPDLTPMDALSASVAADPPAADLGQSITFTCTASGGTSPYVFAWTLGDGNLGAGPTVSHTYTSTGTFTATCTVTDLLLGVATDSKNVVISPNPSVTASVNHNLAAPGTQLRFDAASSGADGSYSFAWDLGDRSPGSGAPTAHAYSQAGSYQATVTLTDGNGGTASDSTSVTISDIAATGDVSPLTGDTTTTFTFTASASGGSGSPYTFAWTFGDGTTDTGSPVAHSYSAGGSYSPFVTASDSLGGSKVAQTQGVTVGSPPAPLGASANSPQTAADVGQSITFTCTGSGGTAPYTYGWTFGDGNSGSGSVVSHAYQANGAMAVTCTVTDATSVSATDSTSVAISPAPSVTASADHPDAAPGSIITFTASASGGDGTSGAGPTITHICATEGNYTPSVRATDALGASRSTSLPLISVSSASSPPVVPLSATLSISTSLPRVNESITLSGTGHGGSGGYACAWDFGDGKTSTGCTTSHVWTAAGHFVVNLSMGDAGGNQTWQNGSVDVQTNLGPPGGPLTVSFVTSTLVAGETETVHLVATGGGGSGGDRRFWVLAVGEFWAGGSGSYAGNR